MLSKEIFRAGTFKATNGQAFTFSEEQLGDVATGYDPELRTAPVTIGHVKDDKAPAYARVGGLAASDGKLIAVFIDVDPQFAALVKAGRYTEVSAAFYLPDQPGNPKPGSYYLHHVAYLGAVAPAVPGLKPTEFSDAAEVVSFSAVEDTTVAGRASSLAAREKAFGQEENRRFITTCLKEGRVPSGHVSGLVAFMNSLNDEGVIAFSEGTQVKKEGELSWFKRFLATMPPMVQMGEFAPSRHKADRVGLATFSAPRGFQVAEASADLHQRAVTYQRAHNVTYSEAVRAVAETGE